MTIWRSSPWDSGEIIRVLAKNSSEISPSLAYMGGATGFQNVPSLTKLSTAVGYGHPRYRSDAQP